MNDNNELLKYKQLSNSKLIDNCRKHVSNLSKLLSDLNTEMYSKNFGLGSDSFFIKLNQNIESLVPAFYPVKNLDRSYL